MPIGERASVLIKNGLWQRAQKSAVSTKICGDSADEKRASLRGRCYFLAPG
jgi:hypothetical protein